MLSLCVSLVVTVDDRSYLALRAPCALRWGVARCSIRGLISRLM